MAHNIRSSNSLSPTEFRAAVSLALLFFLRLLGLFVLLPVLALYVTKLEGATPTRIGLAIGIYALTQAIFQIPMGYLSDKFGRKPVIAGGLVIFIVGSVLAALTNNVLFVIAGRALQGCGAISSATLALAADLTREDQRTKSMAFIGVSIGLAFSSAFVLGPMIDGQLGLSGVFWTSAALGLAALVVLFLLVPTPSDSSSENNLPSNEATWAKPGISVLGGFFLHGTLATSFVAIPIHIAQTLNLPSQGHYIVYFPVIIASLILVAPLVILSNRSDKQSVFTLASIGALPVGLGLLTLNGDTVGLSYSWVSYLGLVVFFLGFNYLEIALPSQVSKDAGPKKRGQVMGSYATLQFLGIFFGALLGGSLLEHRSENFVLGAAAMISITWFILAFSRTRIGSSPAAVTLK